MEINKEYLLNASPEDSARFGEELFEISKSARLSFSAVAKLAISYARRGLSIEDILKSVRIDVSQNGIK